MPRHASFDCNDLRLRSSPSPYTRCTCAVQLMSMPLFTERERDTATAIGPLVYENPFRPGRLAAERRVLGEAFQAEKRVWSLELHGESNPNLAAIAKVAEELAEKARASLPTPRRRGENEEISL